VRRIVELATAYGRYGYRRVTALLRREGWKVNHKRVERLWRREGLKVPQRQPKRRRLWMNDGSCVRLRSVRKDHVWSYDLAQARTHDGRAFRLLVVIDEHTRECLSIDVGRRISSQEVLDRLARLFACRAIPEHLRSDITAGERSEPTGSEAEGRVRRMRPQSGAQRAGVHGKGGERMAGKAGRADALH